MEGRGNNGVAVALLRDSKLRRGKEVESLSAAAAERGGHPQRQITMQPIIPKCSYLIFTPSPL